MVSFSIPQNWNCFKELCSTYPRNVKDSKVFRITVEEALVNKNKKGSQSITDFANKYAFGLDSDVKLWKEAIKTMTLEEVRELHKTLRKREGLLGDEVVKRTR
jgi:hypothetical protein